MRINRRSFLKTSAAVGASAAVVAPRLNALAQDAVSAGKAGTSAGAWKPTTCQGCTTWCPAEVFVQDGRAVKMRGNPLSKQNNGQKC